jgi:cytochrome c
MHKASSTAYLSSGFCPYGQSAMAGVSSSAASAKYLRLEPRLGVFLQQAGALTSAEASLPINYPPPTEKGKIKMSRTLSMTACVLSGAALILAAPVAGAAVDAAAAQALAKESECFKCHTVDKTKKGPSYKKIAAKYKGKADAEAKLIKHITSGQKVKLEDGSEEDHKIIETKDEAQLKNLVGWILSL